jgi:hypothetical protein
MLFYAHLRLTGGPYREFSALLGSQCDFMLANRLPEHQILHYQELLMVCILSLVFSALFPPALDFSHTTFKYLLLYNFDN